MGFLLHTALRRASFSPSRRPAPAPSVVGVCLQTLPSQENRFPIRQIYRIRQSNFKFRRIGCRRMFPLAGSNPSTQLSPKLAKEAHRKIREKGGSGSLGQKGNGHPCVSSLVKAATPVAANYHLPYTWRWRQDPGRCTATNLAWRESGVGTVLPRKGASAAGTPWYATKTNRTDVADTSTPDRLASGDDVQHRLRMPRANAPDSAQGKGGSAPRRGRYGRRDRSSNRLARVVGSNPGLRKRRTFGCVQADPFYLNYLSSFRAIHHYWLLSSSRI